MVKGVTRRFVLVESPDTALFEKAIFILKDGETGTSALELEREAMRITREYLRRSADKGRKRPMTPAFWTLIGAGTVAILWFLAWLF